MRCWVDKNPRFQERARLAAASRWGPPRRWLIGDLSPDQRAKVQRMIESMRRLNSRQEAADGPQT